jgi:hypothetical protein
LKGKEYNHVLDWARRLSVKHPGPSILSGFQIHPFSHQIHNVRLSPFTLPFRKPFRHPCETNKKTKHRSCIQDGKRQDQQNPPPMLGKIKGSMKTQTKKDGPNENDH